MGFRDDIARMLAGNGIVIASDAAAADLAGELTLRIRRGAESVVLPCRADLAADTPPPDLMIAALHAVQIFHECDDILEWSRIYRLDPGDAKIRDEFRRLDDACWQFRALLGDDLYEDLMTSLAIGQAIGAAAAGFPPPDNRA